MHFGANAMREQGEKSHLAIFSDSKFIESVGGLANSVIRHLISSTADYGFA
jgi:hypothetical protein